MADLNEEYQQRLVNDALLYEMHQRGMEFQKMVVVMSKDRELLMKRIIELESIAPRKLIGPHGIEYVWHCPNDLIPSVDLRRS